MDDIKAGDVVQLKGGGPLMTVEEVRANADKSDTFADCLWFTCGTLDSRTINVKALKKLEDVS